jgi:hypothetical protein
MLEINFNRINECFASKILNEKLIEYYDPKELDKFIERADNDYIKKNPDYEPQTRMHDWPNLKINTISIKKSIELNKYSILLPVILKNNIPTIDFVKIKGHNKYLIFNLHEDPNENYKIYFYNFIGIYLPGEITTYYGEYTSDGKINFLNLANKYLEETLDKIIYYNNNIYYINNNETKYNDNQIKVILENNLIKELEEFKKKEKQNEIFKEYLLNENTKIVRQPIPEEIKQAVWLRDEGKCVYCGLKENLQYDHIIPFSKGGNNTIDNLQILCESCNKKKSNKI